MIKIHGDISLFSMQGLEKMNDFTTQHYFSSTNRHKDFLIQLLEKNNRMDVMNSYNEYDYYNDHIFKDFEINDENL